MNPKSNIVNKILMIAKKALILIGPVTIAIATLVTSGAYIVDEIISDGLKQTNPSWMLCHPLITLIRENNLTILLAAGAHAILIVEFMNKKEHELIRPITKIISLFIPIVAVFTTIETSDQRILFGIIIVPTAATLFTIFCNNDKTNTPRSGF